MPTPPGTGDEIAGEGAENDGAATRDPTSARGFALDSDGASRSHLAGPPPFQPSVSPHYEERLEKDIDWIRQLIAVIGHHLVEALDDAVTSVLRVDKDRAAATVIGDYTVNRQTRELDRLCHAFVARHLPSAGHLRYVSSVLRLSIALERVGDYAATIARTAAQLTATPPPTVGRDIEMMAEQARRTLADSLQAFDRRDVKQAQATLAAATQFARFFDRVFDDLVREGESGTRPIQDLFVLIATFNRLERVIHQAKNVCEETIFVATGRTKDEKTFQILFVDAQNSGPSQLAEHYAKKAFPNSGSYDSAGWQPAEAIDPVYRRFAATVGIDLQNAWPTALSTLREQFDQYQFVIGLDPAAREHLPPLPFHTTALTWETDPNATPEEVYRQLSVRLRDLMERLRGDQAG
jgi:phosphate transport system protein